jgi:probable DNA metabolism protein
MMLDLIYDGSFEGLMTCMYDAFRLHYKLYGIYPEYNYQGNLLIESKSVAADTRKAEIVCTSISSRVSHEALENILYVFLSENNDLGIYIYNYLSLAWKVGSIVDSYLSNDSIFKIHSIKEKVLGERHRMLGLIRFRHLKGDIYYAPIEPDYNITGLLVPHFIKRIPNENFIIHDIKRNIAALYNTKECILADFSMAQNPILDEDEYEYQELWKQYFKSISITERANPLLQRRNLPVRYWKYLTEMTLSKKTSS